MQQNKIKSFFERPEGTTGMVFIAAFIVAALGLGYYFLPVLITILQNTIHAAILGGVVLGGVGLVMNDKFRFLISSMFKSAMRWLTGWFTAVDPIGILKNYIEDMKEKIRKINTNIAHLSGEIRKIQASITERKNNIEKYMRYAKAGKDLGKTETVQLNTRKAAREKEYVDKLSVTVVKMQGLEKILNKMSKNVNFLLEDTEHEVEIKEAEYKSMKAAHKAMKTAQDLIEGDRQKELFNQTLEFIADDVAKKLGEIDRFMETSEEFMSTMDVQNAVFNEEGLDMLTKWEEGSLILDYDSKKNSKGKMRVDTSSQSDMMAEFDESENQKESSFSNIF